MITQNNKSGAIVRQYARALTELDVDLIRPVLHPKFKFVYRIKDNEEHTVSIRKYISHLSGTFPAMRAEEVSIQTEFFSMKINQQERLCIWLLPSHDRRIIYPLDSELAEEARLPVTETKFIMLPKLKDGLLYKIECYNTVGYF